MAMKLRLFQDSLGFSDQAMRRAVDEHGFEEKVR
jgi:hypothetical protein